VSIAAPNLAASDVRERPVQPLRAVAGGEAINVAAAEQAVRDLLVALGRDHSAEHLRATPRRVVGALAEMLTPAPFDLTTFANEEGYDELVVARDIPFRSLCLYQLLPFHGVAHVGDIPAERIAGLSKLARVVELFARDLQVQERLTKQVADWLQTSVAPEGVVLEAEHHCMKRSGVRATGSRTVTSAVPRPASRRCRVPPGILRRHRHPLLAVEHAVT